MERRGLNKLIIPILLMMFILSFVNAQQSLESLGTFKIGEDVLLTQLCGTCTFNNITSVTSTNNASELISNEIMVKDGTKYTFLLHKNNLTLPGTYNVNGVGDKDNITTIWAYTFEMTKTGTILETSESIIYIIVLIGSFLLFLFFFYLAITIPFSDDLNEDGTITKICRSKYFKIMFIWFAHGTFVWFLTILLGIANNFLTLEITLTLLRSLYLIFYGLFLANTIGSLALYMIFIYKDILLNKELIKYGKAFIEKNER